jgi:hemolysin activation/secretion protein
LSQLSREFCFRNRQSFQLDPKLLLDEVSQRTQVPAGRRRSDLHRLETKANISGQFASELLLSSQTFYLGGATFGPGYYNADNGIAGLVELRFDRSTAGTLITHYQLYAFTDGGEVWNAGAPKQWLASVGAGVRLDFVDEFRAGAAIAFPVNYSSRTDEFRDARFLFSLSKSFKLCPERPRFQCL